MHIIMRCDDENVVTFREENWYLCAVLLFGMPPLLQVICRYYCVARQSGFKFLGS